VHRLAHLARDAIGAAPREQAAFLAACFLLAAVGVGLLGAAAYHALAEAAGPQAARLLLGVAALLLAGLVWAVGQARARRRHMQAVAARAALARELAAASPVRPGLAGAAVAFAAAFLAGRRR
jgi:hypothetical protein